jgi:membrane-anchored glycerophosphoryl diester phosphodiesterase (GDPDase)
MTPSLREKFPAVAKFDINLAFEVGWKGYAGNVGMGALLLFIATLLIFLSCISVVGILFVMPHIAVGISLVGYYMAKGPVNAGILFIGFRKYGRVIGAICIVWLVYLVITAIFSGPYYYHLLQAMSPEVDGTAPWAERFVSATLNADVQMWAPLQYLAYPFQFYLQARFLTLFPLLIEEDASVADAFAHSWRITARVHGQLLLFMFLATILSLFAAVVGVLGLVVGMFFTLPFVMALIGAGTRQLLEPPLGTEQP